MQKEGLSEQDLKFVQDTLQNSLNRYHLNYDISEKAFQTEGEIQYIFDAGDELQKVITETKTREREAHLKADEPEELTAQSNDEYWPNHWEASQNGGSIRIGTISGHGAEEKAKAVTDSLIEALKSYDPEEKFPDCKETFKKIYSDEEIRRELQGYRNYYLQKARQIEEDTELTKTPKHEDGGTTK